MSHPAVDIRRDNGVRRVLGDGLEEISASPYLLIEPGISMQGRLGGEEGEEVAVCAVSLAPGPRCSWQSHPQAAPGTAGLGQDRRGAKALHEEQVHVR